MRKIRYTQNLGVPRGPSIQIGQEAQVADADAERLIAKGFAEPASQSSGSRAAKPSSKEANTASKKAAGASKPKAKASRAKTAASKKAAGASKG